jgi:ribosome modulation factor
MPLPNSDAILQHYEDNGYCDYFLGFKKEECPHKLDAERRAWFRGWEAALKEEDNNILAAKAAREYRSEAVAR